MSYPIRQNLIPGLPTQSYIKGGYVGVIAHATAVYNDTAEAERNYEAGHWRDAFVHFFVDDTGILQVADVNHVAWGAGHTANHLGYAQVELCQTRDTAKFNAAYGAYTWLLAKLLHDKGLPVVDGQTLMSHAQVSAKWHETDHTDPIEYLQSHGKSWANLVNDVRREYDAMDVKPQNMCIDSPQNNAVCSGVINVAGWSLSPAGIAKVEVTANGITFPAKLGASRPDVAKALPGYPDEPNCGFTCSVDTSKLPNRMQALTVAATGKNGQVQSKAIAITVRNACMAVDTPKYGAVVSGVIGVGGWALDPSGVAKVDIMAGGRKVYSATTGLSRPDVDKVFPGYPGGAKSGFTWQVDTTVFPNGLLTIKVVATGKNGQTTEKDISVNVNNPLVDKEKAALQAEVAADQQEISTLKAKLNQIEGIAKQK